jgi:excinuclease UvrABC ATPase subunit
MITQERLKQLATYEPETGLLICAVNRKGSKNKIGDVLGSFNKSGYVEVQLDGRKYFVHRLAWLYMTGFMPEGVVDHINRDKKDNRWSNLRVVTQVENGHNQNRLAVRNSTGYVGVHRWNGKYRAKIVVKQKQIHLGTFNDPVDAYAAYEAAKQKHQPPQEAKS